MWNSSLNKEYDNLLVVDLTAGTIDYQAGADGQYWDYTMVEGKNLLGTGPVDLSYNYGQIPHESTSLAVNLENGSVTIGGDITATAYLPGAYSKAVDWAYSSGSFTVPEGSIALLFTCTRPSESEYEWDNTWNAYGDFVRFYLRPLYYVMIFAKQ